MTSLRTTQVTGPKPIEKNETKEIIATAETGPESVLSPYASKSDAKTMTSAEVRRMGRVPVRSMMVAGRMVRGILKHTMPRAMERELPRKTGWRIRVEKYMTGVSYANRARD
jgi:hypothetical protein